MADIDLGANYEIDERNGDELVIEHTPSGDTFTYTPDTNKFNLTAATVSDSPTDANDVAIKSYVDSIAQGLDWQDSVIDEQNDPPASPTTGDRYLINDSPTGAWSGNPNEITEWDGSAWEFFAPNEGWALFLEDVDLLTVYNDTDWVAFGSAIDHGALAGLTDDDHTQYVIQDGSRTADAIANTDYNEAVGTQTGTSGTVTIDLSAANMHEVEADGDITIAFSNVTSMPPGNSILLRFEDTDTTGPHTITWPSSVEWSQGTVRDTIGQDDDLEIALRTYDGGATWYASRAGVSFA